MKTLLKSITLLAVFTAFLTGCASNRPPMLPKVKSVENGVYTLEVKQSFDRSKDRQVRYTNILKITLKKLAEITKKEGAEYFAFVIPSANHLEGFPFNTFKDLHSFCFSGKLTDKTLSNRCGNIIPRGGSYKNSLKFVLLKNPDYRISAFNANDLLKELEETK